MSRQVIRKENATKLFGRENVAKPARAEKPAHWSFTAKEALRCIIVMFIN